MEQPFTEVEEYIRYGTPPTTKRDCDVLEMLLSKEGTRSPRLMDLGCGTGRHSLEMARRGFNVTGIDISTAKINYAKKVSSDEGLMNCKFEVGDFTNYQCQGKVDCVFCLFNTISIIIQNDDIIGLFENVSKNMEQSGIFVIDLYSMWKFISERSFPGEDYERDDEREEIRRIEKGKTVISNVNNVYWHNRKVQYKDKKKTYPEVDRSLHQRVYSINEIDLIGRLTGFQLDSIYSGQDLKTAVKNYYDYNHELSGNEMVYVLRKK